MGTARSAPTATTREPDSVWSTSSTLQHADLTKAPFWLTPELARSLPRVWRAGITHGPKLWAVREQAEAAAITLHGAVALAERRRAEAKQSRSQQLSARNGTVVLLHGAGDSGAAIAAWCNECGLSAALCRRGLAIVAPDAPWRRFSPACGEMWRVWYDRRAGSDVEDDIEDACGAVALEVRRAGVHAGGDNVGGSGKPHVVFVVGFSQGGSCALHCALRGYLDGIEGPSHVVGGVASMAGWLDRASASYTALWARGRGEGRGEGRRDVSDTVAGLGHRPPPPQPPARAPLDLLLLHGLSDEVVPAAWVQRNEQRLNELAPSDGSVTVRRHGMSGLAHEISPEEIAVLVTWIDERLSALGFPT